MKNDMTINYNECHFRLPSDTELLAAICSSLPEGTAPELLVALADHRSTQVLTALASRSDLPEAAVEAIAKSGNITVRRTLAYSDVFKAWASTELLIEWCAVDEEFARAVAERLMDFEAANTQTLFDVLAAHVDPDVRKGLAEAWQLPKQLRKKLVDDQDVTVSRVAKEHI